ncbi:MAG TPA: hypothetical protein ENJ46_04710 [Hellea balneolensis]|uniref:ABC-2 type transporter transmembrane domain-containing protein n=1 Tax=Hellea balneolensis TaxID=287478 RepID=A0A7C3C3I6_9PROT|nr:hypothetical protein [Hellea balneolensis]
MMLKIDKGRWQYWFYASWFKIAVRYRKTLLGPIWLVVGPLVFVVMLGLLYSVIMKVDLAVYVPHLAIGIIIWSLIVSFMNSGTDVVYHNRPQIVHSGMKVLDLVMVNLFISLLQFAHHILVAVGVYIVFRWHMTPYAFVSLIGLALLVINGFWYGVVFGILGARFRDISEIVSALMGVLFFITPILWMPEMEGRGGILGPYLNLNPFYHFLELIRAPLLGTPIAPLSWIVVIAITVGGLTMAYVFNKKFSKQLPTWI